MEDNMPDGTSSESSMSSMSSESSISFAPPVSLDLSDLSKPLTPSEAPKTPAQPKRSEAPEQFEAPESSEPVVRDPNRMVYVLLVVLIICGGNGVGIITAALLWRATGRVAPAVLAVVGITLVALAAGLAIIVRHNRTQRRQAES